MDRVRWAYDVSGVIGSRLRSRLSRQRVADYPRAVERVRSEPKKPPPDTVPR
jgi:hypothetical protein